MHALRNVIDTYWRSGLAYAVGLIASDGHLHKTAKTVSFVSKDRELIDLYRTALGITKEPYRSGRGGTLEKNYWTISFKSRQFHDWLNSIGITPVKSRTIRAVKVPDRYFSDFLRGLYDGDGTFWTHWDTRWPNSFVFHIELCSASIQFVLWLKAQVTRLYGVNGHVKPGAGVYMVRYAKGDTLTLFENMYYRAHLPYLSRKYDRIKIALDFNEQLKQSIKANGRGSSVVVAQP